MTGIQQNWEEKGKLTKRNSRLSPPMLERQPGLQLELHRQPHFKLVLR